MKTLRCPSCGASFQMSAEDLQGRATIHCPGCARVIVVPGSGGPTVADDPDTNAFVEPVPASEMPTAVGASRAALSLPKDRRVSIVILSGGRKGDVVVLEEPAVTIGREGGGADIEVPDLEASRRHAAVDCHGARIVLRDLGSRNGTFVGETQVQTRDVSDQTEFRVGATRFMLVVSPA
ncbi:MAG TPA: FHA domain-containing protein [Vicinamibacteria bacterium]|nr:FHA domain-containing protein [Vicinamibacteria bacterium]